MTATRELIDTLVECATPVQRLRPPLVRAMLWLAFAGLVIALIVMGHGLRPDLTLRLHQPSFAVTTAAALATAQGLFTLQSFTSRLQVWT